MKAYRISGGAARWFVRGTTDPDEALEVLLEECPEASEYYDPEPEVDVECVPLVERAGWFRFNPCNCGEHSWHLDNATGAGRGNFLGVYLDVGFREIEYACDIPE